MTSNVGSEQIVAARQTGGDVESEVLLQVRRTFRPEFLNRIDEMVVFHSLSREQLVAIVGVQLERLDVLLRERSLTLDVSKAARDWIAREGYDPDFGARPIKRVIEKKVKDPLATRLLEGRIVGDALARVDVDVDGGGLTFELTEHETADTRVIEDR